MHKVLADLEVKVLSSPKKKIVRTYVELVMNICHLELANPLTKHTLLVIW